MTDREKFIRFKNRLLGPTFMNDGTHFAHTLGLDDFMFWQHIEEKPPYLPATIPLTPLLKGQVILERVEIEPSPKRMAELLQGIYDTYAFYSTTPRGDYDDHWRQFASWLQGHVKSIGLTGMKIKWMEEPEAAYTTDITHERYWMPGQLEITYDGPNWGEEESKKILEHSFTSRILEAAKNRPAPTQEAVRIKKAWRNTTIGQIIIGVIIGLIVAGLTFWIGWK
jgi:hypothetical protein